MGTVADHIEKKMFWQSNPEWYAVYDEDDEFEVPHLTDAAPPEAVESYNYWKKWYDKSLETGIIYN